MAAAVTTGGGACTVRLLTTVLMPATWAASAAARERAASLLTVPLRVATPVLDCGLDGLVAEGTVAGDAALEGGGQAGVIGGRGGWGAFAGGEADNQGESGDGQDGARSGEAFGGVHWSPFPVANTFTANTVNHFTGIRCETPVRAPLVGGAAPSALPIMTKAPVEGIRVRRTVRRTWPGEYLRVIYLRVIAEEVKVEHVTAT